MELLATLVSTNKNRSIMDIVAKTAKDLTARKEDIISSIGKRRSIRDLVKNKLIDGAAKTLDLMSEDVANSIFSYLAPAFDNTINDYLTKNKIRADISTGEIKKEGEKMKITLNVSDIDYEGIIIKFLPDIIKSLKTKDPENYVWKIHSVIEKDQDEVVRAVLGKISNSKKEEIIEIVITQYKNSICNAISDFLEKQDIGLAVDDLCVSAG